jgi:hypothetical protein
MVGNWKNWYWVEVEGKEVVWRVWSEGRLEEEVDVRIWAVVGLDLAARFVVGRVEVEVCVRLCLGRWFEEVDVRGEEDGVDRMPSEKPES